MGGWMDVGNVNYQIWKCQTGQVFHNHGIADITLDKKKYIDIPIGLKKKKDNKDLNNESEGQRIQLI